MAEERVQRRLAAIVAADVVGYGLPMGEVDTGTVAQLISFRGDRIFNLFQYSIDGQP